MELQYYDYECDLITMMKIPESNYSDKITGKKGKNINRAI